MPHETVLPVLRELVRCYQAFERLSASHIRTLGLTPPQFDVIVTLGNTQGLSFKDLGERTLITKGTLTGVVDRLTEKGLVQCALCKTDARSKIVMLTATGERTFKRTFLPHLEHCRPAFEALTPAARSQLVSRLAELRRSLEAAQGGCVDEAVA
jgi:MarR family transcriptional regulator, 2-MHQ and catechol-resistance regulon repressor